MQRRTLVPLSTNACAEMFPLFIVNIGTLALNRIQLIGKAEKGRTSLLLKGLGREEDPGTSPWKG